MPSMPSKKYRTPKTGKRTVEVKKNWLKNPADKVFYDSVKWRKLSIAYKMRHPVCEVDGCTQASYFTDHIKPISDGGDKLAWDNLQALCKSHNASKTAKQVKRR